MDVLSRRENPGWRSVVLLAERWLIVADVRVPMVDFDSS